MSKYNIYGIGAALVDTEVEVSEAFLDQYHIEKGVMTLVDQPRQAELLKALDVSGQTLIRKSGGSACNTIVAAANFGANTAFSGKVAQDNDGDCFAKDLTDAGVSFYGSNADDAVTGKCLVMVTKDAERTMNTLIGAAAFITPEDLDAEVLKQTKVFFAEGYLFDSPQGVETFFKACDMVHAGGGKVVLSLSDSFCVERHLDTFNQALAGPVDMVMSNDAEAKAMFGGSSIQDRIAAMQQKNIDGVITRSADGAVIVMSHEVTEIAAEKVDQPVDLTGAGDQFAAGFLSGVASGKPMENAGRRGAVAAAEVIKHVGPRPQVNLQDLIKAANLA